jgi:hypothetical protein
MSTPVRYDRETITKALTVLVFCNGNAKMAKRKLAEMDLEAPTEATLRNWRDSHADIYEDAKSRHTELFTEEADDLVRDAVTFQQRAVRKLNDSLDEMDPKDVSNAGRNVAVMMGLAFDKSQLAKGQPTARIEIQDAGKILEELNKLHALATEAQPSHHIDGTADDITEEEQDG